MATMRLKVPTEDLIAKVEAKRNSEAAEYEAAKVKYEKDLAAFKSRMAEYRAQLVKKAIDWLGEDQATSLGKIYNKKSERVYSLFFTKDDLPYIEVPEDLIEPRQPSPPRPQDHEAVLRMLRATSQTEIAVSVNDELGSYL